MSDIPIDDHLQRVTLIASFAADGDAVRGSAEAYWREHAAVFSADLCSLCELLAEEYRVALARLSPSELTNESRTCGRQDALQQRLLAVTPEDQFSTHLRILLADVLEQFLPEVLAVREEYAFNEADDWVADGGFKRVYRATQANLNRAVALKFPLTGDEAGSVTIEARLLGLLNHQNVPSVHFFQEANADSECFIVEAFVEGSDWQRVMMEQRRRISTSSEWDRFLEGNLRILQQVCQPLRHAHEELGLVHIDVKPGNVMLRCPLDRGDTTGEFNYEAAEVFVVDWGEGVFVDEVQGWHESLQSRFVTRNPDVSGTPDYRPPELNRLAGGKINFAAIKDWRLIDVYCLGATLSFVLDGHPPRTESERTTPASGAASGNSPFHLPQELVALRDKAIAPRPEDRHPSVEAFVKAVDRYLRNVVAMREIDATDRERLDWEQRIELPDEGDDAESAGGLVSDGIELVHRFDTAARQIMDGPWAPSERRHEENPVLAKALFGSRNTMENIVKIATHAGDFHQALAINDKLSYLPGVDAKSLSERESALKERILGRRVQGVVLVVLLLAAAVLGFGWLRTDIARQADELAHREQANRAKQAGIRLKILHSVEMDSMTRQGSARLADSMVRFEWARLAERARGAGFSAASARFLAAEYQHGFYDVGATRWLEQLSQAMTPQHVAPVFGTVHQDAHLKGTNMLGVPFDFVLTHNTFSPRSGLLIAAGVTPTNRLRAWDLNTFQPVAALNKTVWEIPLDDRSLVAALAMSPDEQRLAVGLSTGELRILDMTTGKQLAEVDAHVIPAEIVALFQTKPNDLPLFAIAHLAWSADGRYVASSGAILPSVRIWHAETLEEQRFQKAPQLGPRDRFSIAQFVGAGLLVYAHNAASRGGRSRLIVVDVEQGIASVLPTTVSNTVALAASRDGSLIALGGQGNVEVWDTREHVDDWLPVARITTSTRSAEFLQTGSAGFPDEVRQQLQLTDAATVAMAFSSDGRLLALTRGDGTLAVISIPGEEILCNGIGMPPASAFDSGLFPHFTPTGGLFTMGMDGRLVEWDLAADDLFGVGALDGTPNMLSLAGSDGRFYRDIQAETLSWYDPADARNPLVTNEPFGKDRLLEHSARFGADLPANVVAVPQRDLAAVAFADGGVGIVDLKTGQHQNFATPPAALGHAGGRPRDAAAIDASHDGKYVAANHAEGGIVVVDVDKRQVVSRLDEGTFVALAFQPGHSETIATISTAGQIAIRSIEQTEAPIKEVNPGVRTRLIGPLPESGKLCFSPDGQYLVATAGDTFTLYETQTWTMALKWKGHQPTAFAGSQLVNIQSLAFRDDGKLLASLAADGNINLWELTTQAASQSPFPSAGEVRVIKRAVIPVLNLRSYQLAPELAEAGAIDEQLLVSPVASLRFLPKNRLFVDTMASTARIYDLSAIDDLLNGSPREILALTEGLTGLTIRDPRIEIVDGEVETNTIRVEFDPAVWNPEAFAEFSRRVDLLPILEAVQAIEAFERQGRAADAEKVVTEYLSHHPLDWDDPAVESLIRRRIAARIHLRNYTGAIEDCDHILKGFVGWPLQPDGSLEDSQSLSFAQAHTLELRAQATYGLARGDEALTSSMTVAVWAMRELARPGVRYSQEDREDLKALLRPSMIVAVAVLIETRRLNEAKELRRKVDALLN